MPHEVSRLGSAFFVVGLAALLTLVAPVRAVAAGPVTPPALLPVPFLPQTEALCGGAAAAMLFRHLGDRHADVQQFAALVERDRGGIAANRLVDAIAARGWTPTQTSGTLERLRQQLERDVPVMLLIEDRPSRYHFVVAVGWDDRHVYVHDPTWGPARPVAWTEFERVWRVTENWMLVIAPGREGRVPATHAATGGTRWEARSTTVRTACDGAVDTAVAAVRAAGLDAADRILGDVRATCPASSRPVSELAGVRFVQQRYREAIDLAGTAVRIDPGDVYAWEVLGSARFVRDDTNGALAAWNVIDRPRLDLVRIEGLARIRFASVAQWLPLVPNTTVTAQAYGRAERRLNELPGLTSARLRLAPTEDGWAEVTAAVLERESLPHGTPAWLALSARTAIGRELPLDIPGWSGSGEVWSINWRWWPNRPRVGFGFAAPSTGRVHGVWRVDASWTAQAYEVPAGPAAERDTQRRARLSLADWITPNLRYELRAGLDVFGGPATSPRARTVGTGLALKRRVAGDRLTLTATGDVWWPVGTRQVTATSTAASQRFHSVELRGDARSTPSARGLSTHATLGAHVVSAFAPRLLWPGAGDVYALSPLLRAHPLTSDGVVGSPVFGRQLVFGSIEQRRWFNAGPVLRIAVAAFVDAARSAQRSDSRRPSTLVDAGLGLRLRFPGHDDVLRVDYGRGLRDNAGVVSIGWTP